MRESEIDFLMNAKSRLKILNDTIKTYISDFDSSTAKDKQIAYNHIISKYGAESLKDFSVTIEDLKKITQNLDNLL